MRLQPSASIPTGGPQAHKAAITGDGFIGKLATIYWDDKKLIQNVPVSKTGQINFTFEIPSSTKGDALGKGYDDSNWANINASADFSITPSISHGTTVGQTPNHNYRIRLWLRIR